MGYREKKSMQYAITVSREFGWFEPRQFFLILVAMLAGCASVDKGMMAVSDGISSRDPVTGQRQINLVSEEQEIREAEDRQRQILTKAREDGIKVDNETPYYERVTRVFDRLKIVTHRKQLPWEVHVLDLPEWNAYAFGGGKVLVLSGIFQGETGLKDDNELAAILAHEIAHNTARHVSESQGKLTIAKLADKRINKLEGFDASFLTNQEDEADKYSVLYLALAGDGWCSRLAENAPSRWKLHRKHDVWTSA